MWILWREKGIILFIIQRKNKHKIINWYIDALPYVSVKPYALFFCSKISSNNAYLQRWLIFNRSTFIEQSEDHKTWVII